MLIKIPTLGEPDLFLSSCFGGAFELLIFSVSLLVIGWVLLATHEVGHLLGQECVHGM